MHSYYYRPPGTVREKESKNVITVFGEGRITATPNIAIITIGILTENINLQDAQRENSETSAKVIQAMLDLGIDQSNIQTTEYRINNVYDYVEGRQVFRGYEVRHLLTVKVTDINKIGTVVDTAISQGANNIFNIRFDVSQRNKLYQDALKLAVDDANTKARTIASQLGVNLNQIPIHIEELPQTSEISPYRVTFEQAASTPIEPGTIEIQARVKAKYTSG